jgi:fructose-1,6-bisphosphatase/inositol monophosphatase family enzyme
MTLTQTETKCLEAFRQRSQPVLDTARSEEEAWLTFGLSVAFEAGTLVRQSRSRPLKEIVQFKDDGSPVTEIEIEIELLCRQRLQSFRPNAAIVGEESGGDLPTTGIAVAIDPIDGTWALLNRTATCAVSLAVFRDGRPFCSIVLNPATGEIGYSLSDGRTRLLQVSAFGEDDFACDLPLAQTREGVVLVNLHPSRSAGHVATNLLSAWAEGTVRMVCMPGGSPAWALLEAAKGAFTYANLWPRQPADAFDLAAGIMLVRNAGGNVTDLDGQPIEFMGHHGPFVASVDEASRSTISKIISAPTPC